MSARAGEIQDVLTFWFVENGREQWFKKDEAFDSEMDQRFADLQARAADGGCVDWEETADGRMALILVLDQFSRNLHRADPRAFAQDTRARAVARTAIALGDHVVAAPDRKLFLYLPFEHSEAMADQEWCMSLFTALGDPELLDYAERHRVIVERFGRFPHRNAVLGRESTPEELEFLQQPGSSF
ncbi:MAG: DUF924 domain-containing protein [Alphaproteobacteria bacterium]|nr:DUF924 domain-containing protein [Alphaproteobacteria bacterium]